MTDQYALIKELRETLINHGDQVWSDRLLVAIRSGSTSSEIIENTNAVLHELLASQDADRMNVRSLAAQALRVGVDQWYGR
jgi:hypothetical protein